MSKTTLTGRLKDMTFTRSGKQIVSVEINEDFRNEYDALAEADLDIEIKKHRRKRSLDANAYAFVLIDKLASALGKSKEEVYRDEIKHIGGVSEIVCVQTKATDKLIEAWCGHGLGWQVDVMPSKIEGCTNCVLYYGSSTYDTKQMSDLISQLIQDCEALGISTMTPTEVESLLSHWGKKGETNGNT